MSFVKRVMAVWWFETGPAQRLKELEKENSRLKKLLAEKELDLSILREVAEGNY